jgi:8-oxo-dGTP pyrophosphatase MutT (NUDIX family)
VADIPDDLPLVERVVARLVVLDMNSRVLLLHTQDPTYPELGTWWELPGGGVEDGESYVDAAFRELHEESGIVVDPGQISPSTWRRDASFRYRGRRYLNHESVLTVQLDQPGPDVDGSHRVDFEGEDYFGYRWWTLTEVAESTDTFYPRRLPDLLPRFLRGDEIEDSFELWS